MLEGRPDDPKVYWFYFTLGIPLTKKGDLDGAIGIWRKMIQLRPDDPMPRSNLGAALARKGDREAGIAELRKAIGHRSEVHGCLIAPWRSRSATRETHDAAIPVWRKLIELLPDDPTAYLELANPTRPRGGSLTLEVRRRGHELGSARPTGLSDGGLGGGGRGAVLGEASQLAFDGLEADSPEDRGKAADRIEALLAGWRKDVDGRRRLEAVGASSGRSFERSHGSSSGTRRSLRSSRRPSASGGATSSPRVDDLARRIEGGK